MKIPIATYRLQFNSQFTFSDAQKIIDYLFLLGISDIYASPIFKATPSSQHGYDVVDPAQINPELGTIEDFEQLIGICKSKDIGWLQDIVPNHMAYDSDNKMLMDIFESGPVSIFLKYFDLSFNHPYDNLQNKVLAPFLGEFYGYCIDKRQIQIKFSETGFSVHYFDLHYPLKIDSYLKLLTYNLASLAEKIGSANDIFLKFLEITQVLKEVALVTEASERARQIYLVKSRLWDLYSSSELIKQYIDDGLNRLNNPALSDPALDLDKLLDEQFFRLAFWKVGNEELNYRRFFTINGLICLRMEDPETFESTHRLIFQLISEGKITGLRVDHLDGLYDPGQYLRNLRGKVPDIYTVVEKVLDIHEQLPSYFSAEGTTGYDFMGFVSGLFVDQSHEKNFDRIFKVFTRKQVDYKSLLADKKRLFIGRYMAGDIDNLAHLLKRLLNRNRYGKDLTMYGLRRALVEIMAYFPVYRTYIDGERLNESDKLYMKESFASAKNRNPGMIFELEALEKIFSLQFDIDIKKEDKEEWFHCIKRFQQFTGPLMAKAGEDTTFYIYNRLISLNEVGSNPSVFGVTTKDFHEFSMTRQERWPYALNATSTHDTKRGEDVRARINVLSEIPSEWSAAIRLWSKINHSHKRSINNFLAPDRDDEYFIYQTLTGAFPFYTKDQDDFIKRMQEYIVKAVREAKVHTAWIKPDLEYEEACKQFIKDILTNPEFLKVFLPFQDRIAYFGVFNSLSQTLVKLTFPGAVDFYQGTELWDLKLVDPDNRRPVDYKIRKKYLEYIKVKEMVPELIDELLESRNDGRIKLFLIYRVLQIRSGFRELFEQGKYVPLKVIGEYQNNVIAFGRQHNSDFSVTVVPRFLTQMINKQMPFGGIWKDTTIVLPDGWPTVWRNMLGEKVISSDFKLSVLLKHFPVILLIRDKSS